MAEHRKPSAVLEAKARALEQQAAAKSDSTGSLGVTIKLAEMYMQALKLTDSAADRKRLDAKCKELIGRAEALKSNNKDKTKIPNEAPLLRAPESRRTPTTREKIIMLEGSKLNNFVFKPWEEPSPDEFRLDPRDGQFVDLQTLSLSDVQLECFDGWKRPSEALSAIRFPGTGEDHKLTMSFKGLDKIDLVQDLTSDCSVVASLSAGTARIARGHQKMSSAIVYPWDHQNQTVALSPNGKYILRFYFNGCWRRVEIDDRLPTSKTERVLHVVDRRRPGLLWPSLVEKAYLKVRGGYDFPGSNSGTDLAVMTGWIPQQIFLHDDDIDPENLWKELYLSTNDGHAMITLGTGKLSRKEQRQLGLAAEHDYAVLELKQRGNIKELLIKNPWANGDVWKGAARRRPNPSSEDGSSSPTADEDPEMVPGTFWMPFNSVFQHYENLYVNWNPGLFDFRYDRHFTWNLATKRRAATILDDHHQFVLTADRTSEVWVLLNRHFRTGDYTHANSGKNGYISIYVFDSQGNRVLSREGALTRGPFVDSPNTLVRFEAMASKRYTIAILQAELPEGKHNFTLTLFSHYRAQLDEASPRYPQGTSLSSQWTWFTAGGSSDSPHYLSNPQFSLTISATQQVAMILRVADNSHATLDTTTLHVKLAVLASDGSRITRIRPRDIVAHSGDYRRGSAVIEVTLLRGNYTVIASTFDQQQRADFTLDLYYSSAPTTPNPSPISPATSLRSSSFATISPISPITPSSPITSSPKFSLLPTEDAGRYRVQLPPAVFHPDGPDRMLVPLTSQHSTRAITLARQAPRQPSPASSLYKISLEQGQGPYKQTIADSSFDEEEYHSVNSGPGLRIEDTLLRTDMQTAEQGGLWLVLERLARGSGSGRGSIAEGTEGVGEARRPSMASVGRNEGAEALQVELLTLERVEFGAWGTGQG